MTLADRADEVLEQLWTETVEHNRPGLDPDSVSDSQALQALVRDGLAEPGDGRVRLTERGRQEARACVRRHRLAERLLADVLQVRGEGVHDSGCRFEHVLTRGLDDNICTLLGHPRTCPHGRPIPDGPCCRDTGARTPQKLVFPLPEAPVDRRLRVCHLQGCDRDTLQKLLVLGALPGTDIVLLQTFPCLVFRVAHTQFAIDAELASRIYVRLAP